MEKKRVIIVDANEADNEIYSCLVKSRQEYDLIGSFSQLGEVINRVQVLKPDILVLGIDINQDESLNLIPKLKKRYQPDFLLITKLYESEFLIKVIGYGVLGVVLRSSSLREVDEALHFISRGGGYLNSQVARELILSFRKSTFSPLTPRESEVMTLLAQGNTYSMIADEMKIAGGTAKIHIKNIYGKLQVTSKADAIAKAREIQLLN